MIRIFLFLFAIFTGLNALPARRYCFEELSKKYMNSTLEINRMYEHKAENKCFDIKRHVGLCLDRALYSVIPQNQRRTTAPSISTRDLYEVLKVYVNVKIIPGMENAIESCAHIDQQTGVYKKVITVGDFSKRCSCDFGDYDDCSIYKRIGIVLQCGNIKESISFLQK